MLHPELRQAAVLFSLWRCPAGAGSCAAGMENYRVGGRGEPAARLDMVVPPLWSRLGAGLGRPLRIRRRPIGERGRPEGGYRPWRIPRDSFDRWWCIEMIGHRYRKAYMDKVLLEGEGRGSRGRGVDW